MWTASWRRLNPNCRKNARRGSANEKRRHSRASGNPVPTQTLDPRFRGGDYGDTMIIGLTGKNAAGKGEVAKFLQERGFQFASLSDVLRDELKRRRLSITRDHLTKVGN